MDNCGEDGVQSGGIRERRVVGNPRDIFPVTLAEVRNLSSSCTTHSITHTDPIDFGPWTKSSHNASNFAFIQMDYLFDLTQSIEDIAEVQPSRPKFNLDQAFQNLASRGSSGKCRRSNGHMLHSPT
ncbi:hypothetical protein DL98DRAFT_594755 [Cadophora sp. DSE1049]|nr:hypothetical protein DL98DRAFT_594755 [Cadophora sp. DSE1049]